MKHRENSGYKHHFNIVSRHLVKIVKFTKPVIDQALTTLVHNFDVLKLGLSETVDFYYF